MLAKGLVACNEFRAAQLLAHYNFVRVRVNASAPITFKSRSNPALFLRFFRLSTLGLCPILAGMSDKPRILNPEVWPDFQRRFERTFGFRPA